ncbi:MAG: hypothetical protein ABH883_00155, partial [Candidatus Omnitrophota bacterium]
MSTLFTGITRKIFSLVVSFLFLVNTFSADSIPAADTENFVESIEDSIAAEEGNEIPEVEKFRLPEYLGTVKDFCKGNSDKVVIHIQDAHCNFAAEKKIYEIMDYLYKKYGIKAVNLEGGSGYYDMSAVYRIKDEYAKDNLVEFLISKGRINGIEAYAIKNPWKLVLRGVEDPDLYFKNLGALKDSLKFKPDAENLLGKLESDLNILKTRIFPEQVLAFYQRKDLYEKGILNFKEYFDYLVSEAAGKKIETGKFTNFNLVARAFEIESGINFRKAEKENREMISMLKERLSRRAAEELVMKSLEYKAGKLSAYEFYSYALDKAAVVDMDLNNFPVMARYVEYITVYNSVNNSFLMKEIRDLETLVRASFFTDDNQRELDKMLGRLAILKKLFAYSLMKEDHSFYMNNYDSFNAGEFMSFISRNSTPEDTQKGAAYDLSMLDVYRKEVERFYEASFERDTAFLKEMRFQIKRSRDPDRKVSMSVLLTGGFHAENLCELFRQNDISYVSIMPNFVNAPGYAAPYFEVLLGGNTILGDFMKKVISFSPAQSALAVRSLFSKMGIDAEDAAMIGLEFRVLANFLRLDPKPFTIGADWGHIIIDSGEPKNWAFSGFSAGGKFFDYRTGKDEHIELSASFVSGPGEKGVMKDKKDGTKKFVPVYDSEISSLRLVDGQTMTWEVQEAWDKVGIEVGSDSITHPRHKKNLAFLTENLEKLGLSGAHMDFIRDMIDKGEIRVWRSDIGVMEAHPGARAIYLTPKLFDKKENERVAVVLIHEIGAMWGNEHKRNEKVNETFSALEKHRQNNSGEEAYKRKGIDLMESLQRRAQSIMNSFLTSSGAVKQGMIRRGKLADKNGMVDEEEAKKWDFYSSARPKRQGYLEGTAHYQRTGMILEAMIKQIKRTLYSGYVNTVDPGSFILTEGVPLKEDGSYDWEKIDNEDMHRIMESMIVKQCSDLSEITQCSTEDMFNFISFFLKGSPLPMIPDRDAFEAVLNLCLDIFVNEGMGEILFGRNEDLDENIQITPDMDPVLKRKVINNNKRLDFARFCGETLFKTDPQSAVMEMEMSRKGDELTGKNFQPLVDELIKAFITVLENPGEVTTGEGWLGDKLAGYIDGWMRKWDEETSSIDEGTGLKLSGFQKAGFLEPFKKEDYFVIFSSFSEFKTLDYMIKDMAFKAKRKEERFDKLISMLKNSENKDMLAGMVSDSIGVWLKGAGAAASGIDFEKFLTGARESAAYAGSVNGFNLFAGGENPGDKGAEIITSFIDDVKLVLNNGSDAVRRAVERRLTASGVEENAVDHFSELLKFIGSNVDLLDSRIQEHIQMWHDYPENFMDEEGNQSSFGQLLAYLRTLISEGGEKDKYEKDKEAAGKAFITHMENWWSAYDAAAFEGAQELKDFLLMFVMGYISNLREYALFAEVLEEKKEEEMKFGRLRVKLDDMFKRRVTGLAIFGRESLRSAENVRKIRNLFGNDFLFGLLKAIQCELGNRNAKELPESDIQTAINSAIEKMAPICRDTADSIKRKIGMIDRDGSTLMNLVRNYSGKSDDAFKTEVLEISITENAEATELREAEVSVFTKLLGYGLGMIEDDGINGIYSADQFREDIIKLHEIINANRPDLPAPYLDGGELNVEFVEKVVNVLDGYEWDLMDESLVAQLRTRIDSGIYRSLLDEKLDMLEILMSFCGYKSSSGVEA